LSLAPGLVLSLASTFALNWGWVEQHTAAGALPKLTLRRPLASLVLLFRNLRWLAGFLAGILGWTLYVAALALAPLSLVQATSAGGIAVLALLAWRRSGARPLRSEVAGVALGMVGLALLGVSLAGGAPPSTHGSWAGVAGWFAVSAVVAGLATVGGRRLGVAAGVLYAAGDVGTKFAVAGGTRLALAPAVLAAHGLAFVCVQLAFQRGSALASAGAASLLTNSLPIAAGLFLFGERMPGGASGAARAAAFACVVAGAALLARPEKSETSSAAAIASGAEANPSSE
jgi:drug/metabolite transporter (DMT)-like permease